MISFEHLRAGAIQLPKSDERWRDLKLLAFSLVVIVVAMAPLTEMLVRAWDTHGVFWQMVVGTTDALGLNIDLAVVVPVGVYLGWLVLFLADRAKAIQPVLLVVAAIPFLLTLNAMGAWSEHVAWGAHLPALGLGVLVGAVTGGGHRFVLGNRAREFPRAAAAMFVVAVGVCLAGFVQMHLLRASTPGRVVVDFLAALSFLAMFGTFVQYTDRKDVLLMSPVRSGETMVLVGLYDAIEESMAGTVVEGRRGLIQASADLQHGSDLTGIRSTVRFRYRRPQLFSRWISITADGYSTESITERDLSVLRKTVASRSDRLGGPAGLVVEVRKLVPLGRSTPGPALVEKIADAAVLVLVVPLSHPELEPLFDPDAGDGGAARPDFLGVYADLCDTFADDYKTEVVLTVTDPEVAFESYEERHGTSPDIDQAQFQHHVLSTLAGDDVAATQVNDIHRAFRSGAFVALGRSDDADSVLDGVERLLETIGR